MISILIQSKYIDNRHFVGVDRLYGPCIFGGLIWTIINRLYATKNTHTHTQVQLIQSFTY